MWATLTTVYAFVLLALTATAAGVALFITDYRRATHAARILTTLLAATLGSGGLFALIIHLHQVGLL